MQSQAELIDEMMERPEGKEQLGASATPPNSLELGMLEGLDKEKINEFAECLFTLNNRRYGPVPGAYVVLCTVPGKSWCVGQLNADRAKPVVLFEDMVFSSPEAAQEKAQQLKDARGESVPCRNH